MSGQDLSFLERDRPVLILGLGRTGLAAGRAFTRAGIPFAVWDDGAEARDQAAAIGWTLADPADPAVASSAQLLLPAPGIPLTHPVPHPAIQTAKAVGLPIRGDTDLLLQACPNNPAIGITGTNGKSTTTALITHILAVAGLEPLMGGNIGIPALDLRPEHEDQPLVLELSSYQLDLMSWPGLSVAIWLNLTPDHLDRHGSLEGYVAAKRRILAFRRGAAPLVLGVDEPETRAIAADPASGIVLSITVAGTAGATWSVSRDGVLHTAGGSPGPDLSQLPTLRGRHNWQNAAAAIAAGLNMGLPMEEIWPALLSFRGLAHRQEQVRRRGGVTWINDSKATNADAAAHALGAFDRIRWILGGRPKEGGLEGLQPFLPKIRSACLIGEATEPFAAWLSAHAPALPVSLCGTMALAVEIAAAEAEPGDTVLLAPACASFDQYRSFEHRGDAFRGLVESLPPLPGEAP